MKRARLTTLSLGYVEDHSMSVKLGRGVTVYRPRGVVLERGGDELACRFRRVNIADARLGVPLQFLKCYARAFAMRQANARIAANKRCE